MSIYFIQGASNYNLAIWPSLYMCEQKRCINKKNKMFSYKIFIRLSEKIDIFCQLRAGIKDSISEFKFCLCFAA